MLTAPPAGPEPAMSDSPTVYTGRVEGLLGSRHRILGPEGPLGVLTLHRGPLGIVDGARYEPEKGEVLVMRRDPGLLRSQFSLWTEDHEWLGSSLRWSFVGREVAVSTGSRPIRLLPVPGFTRGWRVVAPRTGEMACVRPAGWRERRIEVYRRMDFEVVLFCYFLGTLVLLESLWPGPDPRRTEGPEAAASAR